MCCYSSKSWGFFPHCILFFHLSNTELVNSVIKKEMGRNVDPVCSECTRKCRFLHGKGKSSSLLHTSFFKVMIGEDFSKYMYVPPKFYHNVSVGDLLDKQIILEDPSGEQWKVTVSFVYGSIAFKEGWSAFSFDHGLKIGDFLIFNYTSESHFDVLIYDESACNMLDFSKTRNQKKRSRGRNDSSVKDGLLVRQGLKASGVSISDLPKMKRQHREVDLGGTQHNIEKVSNYDNINATTKSVCIEDYGEDPCYMTSRGLGETERDAKTSMFDVLDCEILNNCDVNGTWKVATVDSNVCDVDCGSHACQNEAIICNKDPLYERILGKGAASDPSELKLSRCNHSLGQKDNSAYDKNCTLKLKENSENNSIMSNRKVRECQFAEGLESEQMVISQKRYASQIGSFYNTNGVLDGIPKISDTIRKGQMSKEIKKEHVDMTPSVYKYKDELPATGQTSERFKSELQDTTPFVYKDNLLLATGSSKVIKREPGQSLQPFNEDNESHSQTAATVSCDVPTDIDTFLELPAPLPLSNKRGIKMKRLVVYLRDELMNLWPVFYHEQSNFYALTEGWSEYRKANNIQPRDLCIFGAENESNRIIAVNIVHK
ncbi:PREDICTED: B3 domain-containing protein Os02g0598200-like isoform X4 [Lupinus angustifolius]|uniref:B3 domain-containing protein Os02g0598200-like isoform X4 n=1 Tax=Lupinus angustifolius TaxID=3871 RepID=UPI00092F24E5|nr:PREDICTED: B3 domain-containing protein Os02g0598200-like isoform X4 [Lupinus angustifolius]